MFSIELVPSAVRLKRLTLVFEGVKAAVAFALVLYVLRCIVHVLFF